jgi:hypothetical protein
MSKQPPPVPEDDVTLETVRKILETAAVECEIDEDQELYVRDENFPIWIALDAERHFLWLHTYAPLENMALEEGIARANELNSRIILNRFWFENGSLAADYGFYYGEGFNPRQLIKLVRKFSTIFQEAFTNQGPDDGEGRPRIQLL